MPKNKTAVKAQDIIDFKNIDWGKVDREKAEFIYREALDNHRGIVDNINVINSKASGMLSFTMPVMAALVGFFAATLGAVSVSLFAASLCAGLFLFLILLLLLFVMMPQGIFPGTGSPGAYFTADFYKGDMRHLLIGNIMSLHEAVIHDKRVLYTRGRIFRIAVVLCAALPAASFIVFLCFQAVLN